MNIKRLYLLLIANCFLIVSIAQPKKVVADKIIAVVGDKIVLKSDIDNSIQDMERQNIEVPKNARCLTLEQAMGIKALVLQAEKDSLPITEEEISADIDNPSNATVPNKLTLTVTWFSDNVPNEYTKGLYVGRFTEELLEHYRTNFTNWKPLRNNGRRYTLQLKPYSSL